VLSISGRKYTVNANKEVILSAGAYQSPQLLELSGIGNPALLKKYGIQHVVDLLSVGENLQVTILLIIKVFDWLRAAGSLLHCQCI
jgi:choline dehydrogenase-like flavoprotein